MYKKEHFEVAAVAAKNDIRGLLNNVAFCGDRVVATDSFRLMEVSADGDAHEPVCYDAKLLKAVKPAKGVLTHNTQFPIKAVENIQYPDIDFVFDKEINREGDIEVKVNAKMLGELLLAISKTQTKSLDQYVTMRFHPTDVRAIAITGGSDLKVRAVMMPAR